MAVMTAAYWAEHKVVNLAYYLADMMVGLKDPTQVVEKAGQLAD